MKLQGTLLETPEPLANRTPDEKNTLSDKVDDNDAFTILTSATLIVGLMVRTGRGVGGVVITGDAVGLDVFFDGAGLITGDAVGLVVFFEGSGVIAGDAVGRELGANLGLLVGREVTGDFVGRVVVGDLVGR